MLKLERVSKYYFSGNNVVQALRRINLEFKTGEFVAITGESGSGKSTLLNILSGLETYEDGKMYFDGKDLSHYTIQELEHYRKNYIGYVFQEFNLINSYTVYQNIDLALSLQGLSKEVRHQKVLSLINQVGLSHATNQRASNLSGGEKQRTVIARTLAKDYQVLVCDEPTGNLNEEASIEIFKIFKEISKKKLVIVVTHDVSQILNYATRKIHIYDGEIMEDSFLSTHKDIPDNKFVLTKTKATFLNQMAIGFRNILAVPKKSILALFAILFLLSMMFSVYSAGIIEQNKPIETSNPYFSNIDSSRIILIKDDHTQFTDSELTEIGSIENVQGIFNNDVVFDSTFLTKKFSAEEGKYLFYYFKPLPALSLIESEIIEGSLPVTDSEVIVGNNGLYEIGDTIDLANSYGLVATQALNTDQFTFTVVGIASEPQDLEDDLHHLYFSNLGLARLAPSSIYENSEISINIYGTEKFDIPTDSWITPEEDSSVAIGSRTYQIPYPTWIQIDNSLEDGEVLSVNLMYFEICRNFSYKKEIRDDMEAGLCDATAFIESHDITYRAITVYENDKLFQPITLISQVQTDSDRSNKLYMNEKTFYEFFGEENYQITVIVKDSFDGNKVVTELKELGYNVFYPSQLLSHAEALEIVSHNLLVSLIVAAIIFVIILVGYFILKYITVSKIRDYLILRSIGASKSNMKNILRFELLYLSIISIILMICIAFIVDIYLIDIPDFLKYFKWHNYLLLIALVVIVLEFIVNRLAKNIYQVNVITALKGVQR